MIAPNCLRQPVNSNVRPQMKNAGERPTKRPSLLRLIIEDVRDVLRRTRQANRLASARERLKVGDPVPMQQLARISVGDAWLALANFYAEHHPEDPALATDAYRNALQCKDGFDRPSLADDEYDRRRLLGVGTTQDLKALAKEWKSWHFPGYGRKTQLAWIHACGPTELRDLKEAWWWLDVAEARWSHCKDIALPTLSVS